MRFLRCWKRNRRAKRTSKWWYGVGWKSRVWVLEWCVKHCGGLVKLWLGASCFSFRVLDLPVSVARNVELNKTGRCIFYYYYMYCVMLRTMPKLIIDVVRRLRSRKRNLLLLTCSLSRCATHRRYRRRLKYAFAGTDMRGLVHCQASMVHQRIICTFWQQILCQRSVPVLNGVLYPSIASAVLLVDGSTVPQR